MQLQIKIFMILALSHSLFAQASSTTNYLVDTSESKVNWKATKPTSERYGLISVAGGWIQTVGTRIESAEIKIDMNSITVLEIDSPEWNAKLVNHLKSDDFFSVDKYPTAVLEISSATPLDNPKPGEPNYRFRGDLQIKGITHSTEFNALVTFSQAGASALGEIVIDRTKYDVRYRSGKFFENLGDKLINDDFTISFDISSVKE